jgi:hypothetical protein
VRSWFSPRYAESTSVTEAAYEGAPAATGEVIVCSGSCREGHFDIPVYVEMVCLFMGNQGMVDERTALYEEMYTRICEENGPCRSCPRHCLEMALLAESGGDLG